MINLCSSEMPRSVGWYISTFRDVLSRVNLDPCRWDRWTVPKRRYLNINQRCVTFQWSWDLNTVAAEAWSLV